MRKLGLESSLWAALLFFPLTGFALGLGEIETSSYLNQPLQAEIEVISARPGEIDDLLISLASRDAFKKAGLERPADLSKLRFQVDKSEDGLSARILVTTKTAIKEPFLSFLVEADWAKGRLLREFTILLDPPSFAQQALAPAPKVSAEQEKPAQLPGKSQPIVRKAVASVKAEPEMDSDEPQQAFSSPIAFNADPAPKDQKKTYVADKTFLQGSSNELQLVVNKGDTLWGVASQFKDDKHSMAQVMLAMQMMNPAAFGNGNINNLKVGAVLRAPDQDALGRFSKQQAYAQVLEQNGLWDEYVARSSGATVVATPVAGSKTKPKAQKTTTQLSLLAPGDGDSDNASLKSDTNKSSGQIRKQLALAEEDLEAARLENTDLKSRIESLEVQLKKYEQLQKLVQIEDSSLALLQDSASGEAISKRPMTTVTEEKPSELMIEAAEAILTGESAKKVVPTMSARDQIAEDFAQSTEAETVIKTAPEDDMDTVPAPIIVTEAPESVLDGEQPSADFLRDNPLLLGGLAALLIIIIGFLTIERKKSRPAADKGGITLEEPEDLNDDDPTPIHVPSGADIGATSEFDSLADSDDTQLQMSDTLVASASEEDQFARTAIISAEDIPATEETASLPVDQDDILNEVDVYLAYGLYDNAEDLLNESLRDNPDRADYRSKLLDTHFATKNKDAFIKEAIILKSLGAAGRRFWDRVQIMGFELAPENDLFSGAEGLEVSAEDLKYVKPVTADFDIGADDDATDFSGTDFDLSNDALNFSPSHNDDLMGDEGSADGALDIDFPDLDALDDVENEIDIEDGDDILSGFDDLADEINELKIDDGLSASDESAAAEPMESLQQEPESESKADADYSLSDQIDAENELDIDFDDEADAALDEPLEQAAAATDDDVNFDFSEDMELSSEQDATLDEIDLDVTAETALLNQPEVEAVEEMLDLDESDQEELTEVENLEADLDVAIDEDEDLTSETLVLSSDELAAYSDKAKDVELDDKPEEVLLEEALEENDLELEDALDFDMSDMNEDDLQTGEFKPSEITSMNAQDLDEVDRQEEDGEQDFNDIVLDEDLDFDMSEEDVQTESESVSSEAKTEAEVDLDFEVDDFSESVPGDIQEPVLDLIEEDVAQQEVKEIAEEVVDEVAEEGADIDLIEEVDVDIGLDKTGTFAPGDFNEEDDDPSSEIDDLSGDDYLDDIGDLMLPDDVDEVGTKLDLARAFIDMGDAEGARSSLEEVLEEGTEEQKAEATGLMNQIG